MERKDIEIAIEQQGVIEIDYTNQMGKRSFLHITRLVIENERNLIAICKESQTSLHFKFERIQNMKWIWRNIFSMDDVASKDGLYVFACKGDNHLEL